MTYKRYMCVASFSYMKVGRLYYKALLLECLWQILVFIFSVHFSLISGDYHNLYHDFINA